VALESVRPYTSGRRAFAPAQFDTGLQGRRPPADERDIMQMQSIALL